LLEVLRREKFRPYLSLDEAEQYVSGIASRAEILADPESPPPVVRDPKDDYLVALARAAAADALVSGDGDLLALDRAGVPIITPAAFAADIAAE
jgi:putative PIN family toxin of toxin-antitoxin system